MTAERADDRHLRLVHDAEAESRARVLEAARERPAHALWALLQELDETGVWEGPIAEIMRRLAVSETTVGRYRRELEAQGILLVETRPGRPSLWMLLAPYEPDAAVTPPPLVTEITSDTPSTVEGVGPAHLFSSSSSPTPFTPRDESAGSTSEAHSATPADPLQPPPLVNERTGGGGGSDGPREMPARWFLRHRVHPTPELAHLFVALPLARVEAAWERMRHYSRQYGRELPAPYLAESLRKELDYMKVPDPVVDDLAAPTVVSEPAAPAEVRVPSASTGTARPEPRPTPRGWGRALLLLAGAAVVARRWW